MISVTRNMWTLIGSPFGSAWLDARLGSGWLEAKVSSARLARYGFIRDSTQLVLSSARGFVLGSVWLCSALSRGSARARLIKVLIYWRVTSQESTYPLVQSFGSQHAAFDTLTREDSETKLSNTRFQQKCLNRFYQPWARNSVRWPGPKLGSLRLRIVVRLDSGLVSRLKTRGLGSTLLEARLGLLKARLS